MRITQDLLIRIAKENTKERTYHNQEIISAYLTGSTLHAENFLLGGTTDIDLVFVYKSAPPRRREIKSLSPDIHLDIRHRSEKEYLPSRALRSNPWLGHELYNPMLLYETKHFFEFTQASLRAGFDEPKNKLKRAYTLLNNARQIWINLQLQQDPITPAEIESYLSALYQAANAIVVMDSPAITERRFLLNFPAKAVEAGHPEFAARILDLLGVNEISASTLAGWLPAWTDFFVVAAETAGTDMRIHSARQAYYTRAIEEMLQGQNPLAGLYPLLLTWTLSAGALPKNQIDAWQNAIIALGLDETRFSERLEGLDQYLDQLEESLEKQLYGYGFEPEEII